MIPPKEPKKEARSWHVQQEKILKDWGESSSCYRFMHYRAYQKYKKTSMRFTLPIIVISTVTGTANFAQETFPVAWQSMVPLGIGGLNLIAAIMTTVLQFLKANELMEGHRVASISYGKLSRTIKLELALPIYERSQDGTAMVNQCRTEYDRLIEQSPPIPGAVLKEFDKKFPVDKETFSRPEISDIDPITLFDSLKETAVVKGAADIFKKGTTFGKKLMGFKTPVDEKADELNMLKKKNLVSSKGPNAQKEEIHKELMELRTRKETKAAEVTEAPGDIPLEITTVP